MNDNGTWGMIIVVIGLAYLIIYLTNKPNKSKRGEKTQLYHGPAVSARWKEKKDRQYLLGFLWYLLIIFILVMCSKQ